jgi:hypothetical protein
MTAQATDTVLYGDESYSLVGAEGDTLFEPAEHGLHPVAVSTGNWAGFSCMYRVEDAHLYLDRVIVGFGAGDREAAARGEEPRLFGVAPELDERTYEANYRDLRQPMAFSGTLTLGADFVWDMYVHMGFHPPWKYRRVYDLTFEAGWLVGEADRSADMARLREAEASGGLAGLFKPLTPTP